MKDDLKKNASGCNDPTAYTAINNIQNDARFYKLLHTIFHICELAGFELQGRVILKDRKTGKIWR